MFIVKKKSLLQRPMVRKKHPDIKVDFNSVLSLSNTFQQSSANELT